MSWVNRFTGTVHAHGMLVGSATGRTACGRVHLRELHLKLMPGTEDLCKLCIEMVETRREQLDAWLRGER